MKKGTKHKKETKEAIRESMQGNSNAEKWTLEETLAMLEKIEEEAQNDDCLWLGSALVKVGLYRDIWDYWKDKFKKQESVFRTIKKIDQIFESKLFESALKGKVNGTVAIFGLKNNYEWKDKTEQDVNLKGKVSFSDMTDEQIEYERQRIAERIAKFGS